MSMELLDASRRIGWITEGLRNSQLELRDYKGTLLGYYDNKSDETRDYAHRLIGKGNLLSLLM